MESLQELFDLYEAEVRKARKKPPLQNQEDPMKAAILSGDGSIPYVGDPTENPVVKQKIEIDQLEKSGLSPEDAYQEIKGPVNLADPMSKAELAAVQARYEKEGQRGNVHPDPESGSIFSRLEKKKEQAKISNDDLKTPSDQETPDQVEIPTKRVAEEVDNDQFFDYNDDVDYLRKYGRA